MSAGKERTSDTKKERKYTTKAIKPYKIPESNSVKPKLNNEDALRARVCPERLTGSHTAPFGASLPRPKSTQSALKARGAARRRVRPRVGIGPDTTLANTQTSIHALGCRPALGGELSPGPHARRRGGRRLVRVVCRHLRSSRLHGWAAGWRLALRLRRRRCGQAVILDRHLTSL